MKTKANNQWSQVWKRNAVVAAIALFVCAAVYLNWTYQQEVNAGKTLGESAMVGGRSDPLVGQSAGGQSQSPDQSQPAGEGTENPAQSPAAASGYFANARLNRQQARDSALTLLQDAAAGEEADQTMKDQASATIQTMADYTVTEAQIENLVVAKGYADCVAFIGDQSLSLAVAAPENGLTEADTARIVDVVGQVSDFTAGQIKIIPVE